MAQREWVEKDFYKELGVSSDADAKEIVKGGPAGWEDLQWLLVNRVEFVHNF